MKVRAVGVVQDVTTDDMDIVSALIAALKERVGAERCGLWFGNQTRLSLRGQTLRVDVPNAFFQDWLRSNFRRDLEECSAQLLGSPAKIEFHVDSELAAVEAVEPSGAAVNGSSDAPSHGRDDTDESPREGSAIGERTASRRHASTKQPDKPRRRYADFASFVVGHSNRVAQASALMVAEKPGCLSPLYIYGGTGVGKTHLLESIISATAASQQKTRTLFVTSEQFTTHYVEATQGRGFPSLRQKYRSPDLLVVDDIHFFIGKTGTAFEFQQTLDAVLRKGGQVVLSGNVPPAELESLGPELTSRISGGACVSLEAPDHAVRLAIVKQLCERNELPLDEEIQQMVASRLTDNARQLSGAINRLHATCRATGERLTVTMAERELADMTMHNGRVVHLPEIEKAVCDVFGLRPESLRSDRKSRTVSQPRMLAMWLARKHTRSALSEIGDYFGRRSHTTVISAQKRVRGWMAEGESIGGSDQHWKAEEVIRRVEAKLRVG